MIPVPHRMLVSMQSSARLMVGRGALPMTSKIAASHIRSPRFASSDSVQRAASKASQSQSPLAPIGVQAALEFAESMPGGTKKDGASMLLSSDEENAKPALPPSSLKDGGSDGGHAQSNPRPKIFDEFALTDRVGIVSGGNGGLGLEMAVALCEAGARAVYCLDLPSTPSSEFLAAQAYLQAMDFEGKPGREKVKPRLEYVQLDVTDQEAVWKRVGEIGDREGRMDVCVAAAGILKAHTDCLRYPAKQFKEVMEVNVNGVLYTAQAAGQQMERFGQSGSIILIASMSGTITNRDHAWVSYNTSKSAVLQMARSMACELGKRNIRVNSLSPGHIYTSMTAAYLDKQPHLLEKWSNLNPMGRIGRPDEMRGVCVWLASDASSLRRRQYHCEWGTPFVVRSSRLNRIALYDIKSRTSKE